MRFAVAVAIGLLLPIGVATIGVAGVASGELLGSHPFAGLAARNSAEAAALADAAGLLRFLRRGEDPHAVYPVRPEVISSAILQATTVEAAMWSRQVEMIELLDREGVIHGGEERASLTCLAVDLEIDDVVDYLTAADNPSRCEAGEALARVTARTAPVGGAK
jgi:hypothetical protein